MRRDAEERAAASSRVVAADGTRLACHSFFRGERRSALPVLLTNGLSTTDNFWSHLVAALAPERPVIHWSYRGHGESEPARADGYSIATHADDLRRVTEAVREAHGEAPVHVAFSMGVTVLLELYRRSPELVSAMVLVAGGADSPYASSALLRVPGVRSAIRAGLRAASPMVPRLGPLARRVTTSRALFPLSRAIGAIGADAPRDEVEHFFRSVGAMDLRAYWESMRSLVEAHASDVLPNVRVPVLVIAPDRDVMAPQRELTRLRDSIPGAEWMEVRRAGHAVLLEAGAEVAERVRRFVGEVKTDEAPGLQSVP